MSMLRPDAFERADRFLREQARPLEGALFQHDFRGAGSDAALEALSAFQNDDGGFGHGLEPDAATPSSGALATSVALHHLASLQVPSDDPRVTRAVAYLRATLDPEHWTWRIVPEDTDAHPHAPWWGSEGLEERFGEFQVNPRGDIVAALYAFPGVVEEGWLEPLAEDTVRAIETRTLEMHDLLNAVSLLESPGIPVGWRARVRSACEAAAESVPRDPAQFEGYGLRPVDLAPRPDAALHHLFADAVHANLDVLVAQQEEDGAWAPSWAWGAYPEAWAEARRAWQGVLTLRALRVLRGYGRIEGVPAAGTPH
jgi:hypothetical protein